MHQMLQKALRRTSPKLVLMFVQGSGARRESCWLIDIQAELPSLRCYSCLTNLPHTNTKSYTHTHTHTQEEQKYSTCRAKMQSTHTQTHSQMHIDPQLSASVWLCSYFFLPLAMVPLPRHPPPPPSSAGGKRAPRGWSTVLIDSREFGGRGASKTAQLFFLSSGP